MKHLAFLTLIAVALPAAASAQIAPMPSYDDPRLQTVTYRPGQPVRLVAFPGTNLALMFKPGERIERVTLSDPTSFRVSVVGANDALDIMPLRPEAKAGMSVETGLRRYSFQLETGHGLAAAYVVRFVDERERNEPVTEAPAPNPEYSTGEYKLSGDKELRPVRISDDGERTYIEWGEYQSLPAVFGIGPSNEEELVDGYMRGGIFTIDRIYRELVFRIDDERAKAKRTAEPGEKRG